MVKGGKWELMLDGFSVKRLGIWEKKRPGRRPGWRAWFSFRNLYTIIGKVVAVLRFRRHEVSFWLL